MTNEITLAISALGVGGLLGALVKSVLDKRQYKFSKAFDYKESRYKAMMILMWIAMNPNEHELKQLRLHRPQIKNAKELENELNLEYHNAMLFASDTVLNNLMAFMKNKNPENWQHTVRAMKKDLYL